MKRPPHRKLGKSSNNRTDAPKEASPKPRTTSSKGTFRRKGSKPAATAPRTDRQRRPLRATSSARGTGTTIRADDEKASAGAEVSVKVLSMVALAVLVAAFLVSPVRQWLNQEQAYRQLRAQVAEATETNAELKRQLLLWQDPEYIAAEARQRLGYTQPGETPFVVIDPPAADIPETDLPVVPEGPLRPWYLVIADTTIAAAQPPKPVEAAIPPPISPPDSDSDPEPDQG